MTAPRARRRGLGEPAQAGFTLVEMLVAMVIFAVFSGVMFTVVASAHTTFTTTQQYNGLNEQAREMLTRLAAQLRATKEITAVTNPGVAMTGPWGHQDSTLTFDMYTGTADNITDVTYQFSYQSSGNGNVTISENGGATPQTVLSQDVSAFQFQLFGSLFQGGKDLSSLDSNHDGKLEWTEIDQDPSGTYGNGNGVLDATELKYLNQVEIDFTLFKPPHTQSYQTTVDIRNQT